MALTKENIGKLHPRNRHSGRYDFAALTTSLPALKKYVARNRYGEESIDFSDPEAVKLLNQALLALHYGIEFWQTPEDALTPAIPGRADYIHYVAELIGFKDGESARCLDIGVGANCIYPIIGVCEYGWDFVGSDISLESIESAQRIVDNNATLSNRVELRHQRDSSRIFEGIIEAGERFDLTICNPPFHPSAQSAAQASMRKQRNLKGQTPKQNILNFGGVSNELWCSGGERSFITKMIAESRDFRDNCHCFTSLVSNEDNLKPLLSQLKKVGVAGSRVIEMSQGNKRSRILAWLY